MELPPAEIDFAAGKVRIETPQGVHVEDLPAAFQALKTSLHKLRLDVGTDRMKILLPGSVEVEVELGCAKGADAERLLAGRKVVYLDQNRWSAMAAWRHGLRPIGPAEATAAERLAELVADRKIVLPFSAGHMVETGPLYDDFRVALASTMLEFSRSWQVRNPVAIRGEELAASLKGEKPMATGLTSLDADVLFATPLRKVNTSQIPGSMAAVFARIVNLSSVYEVLVDREALPDTEGRQAGATWAKKFADLGGYVQSNGMSREQALRAATGMVLADLLPEIAALAPVDVVRPWLTETTKTGLGEMPYLGRFAAVVFARLRQPTTRWTGNDLNDLNFLCCAAGYADVVVGERNTIGALRTARGVPPGAELAATLMEALALVER
jgi:hypothetical protein